MKKTKLLLLALVLLPLLIGSALAAWPLTPLTTYNAGTTPVIKAADLNAFQSAINDLFSGAKSHKSITVEATGATPIVNPTPGTVWVGVSTYSPVFVAGKVVSNTVTPTTSVGAGELPRGLVPLGWAKIADTGSFARGVNVALEPGPQGGAQHPAAGNYVVLFNSVPNDPVNTACQVTATGPRIASCYTDADGNGRVRANVLMYGIAGNLVNAGFQVTVFGE